MAQVRPEAVAHEVRRWLRPDWRRFVQPGSELAARYESCERKYDPAQPRVPAGVAEGGQWTNGGGADTGVRKEADTVQTILEKAKQLAASSRNAYQRCLDLCYPILERFQGPGSDLNTFDFHKCMNACLGKNQ